jgi:hypothetical protein
VAKQHPEQGVKHLVAAGEDAAPPAEAMADAAPEPAAVPPRGKQGLLDALRDLETAKARLDGLLKS